MKKHLIYIIISALIFSSCEDIMDINLDGDSNHVLAVEGTITTDTASQYIILSRTDDYFTNGEKMMETDATVTLSDGENIFTLSELKPGIYSTDSDFYGIAGRTYMLDIKLTDTTEYQAQETIKPLPVIDSIGIRPNSGYGNNSNGLEKGYEVLYYGPEPPEEGQHYLWTLYLNDSLYTDRYFEMLFTDDEFVNGNYIRGIPLFFIPEDDIPTDTFDVKIAMYSISKGFYDFLIGYMLETSWRGSPWDGPSANTTGNISNGAWGYFKTSDVKYAVKRYIREKKV